MPGAADMKDYGGVEYLPLSKALAERGFDTHIVLSEEYQTALKKRSSPLFIRDIRGETRHP